MAAEVVAVLHQERAATDTTHKSDRQQLAGVSEVGLQPRLPHTYLRSACDELCTHALPTTHKYTTPWRETLWLPEQNVQESEKGGEREFIPNAVDAIR